MLFIVGMPRSGTTWLAKIVDSHPDVMYRHEPDSIIRPSYLPPFCRGAVVDEYLSAAQHYLDSILAVRTPKVVGSMPIFAKSYLGPVAQGGRKAIILAAKAAGRFAPLKEVSNAIRIPDFATVGSGRLKLVIKSIGALGHLNLFLKARPDAKAVVIVRHPCGHVASVLRGIALGKFGTDVPATQDEGIYRHLASTEEAAELDLTFERLMEMTPLERLTWRWAISNSKTMRDFEGDPRVRVLRYEDACADPEGVARELIAFAGLEWNTQTERFLRQSINGEKDGEYYRIFRNPVQSAYKWKAEFAQEDIGRILTIARKTPAGRLFT